MALCWVSSPLGFLQGGYSGQKYVHKHKRNKKKQTIQYEYPSHQCKDPNFRRVEERGAVIGFLTGLAFVAWIGWDFSLKTFPHQSFPQDFPSSKHSLCPTFGSGGMFPSRLSLFKTFFFLFQEFKADKFWKGLEVPSLHQWSFQYQPPIAQFYQVCLNTKYLIYVRRILS